MVKKSTVVLEFLLIGAIVTGIVLFSKLKKDEPKEPKDPGTEDPGTEDPGTEDPGTEDLKYVVSPSGLAVGANGDIYISDSANNLAFKIDKGTLTPTLLGNKKFTEILSVAVDNTGNVYVTDVANEKAFLYKIDARTNTTKVVDTNVNPIYVLVSAKNNIFFLDDEQFIYKIDPLGVDNENIKFTNFTIDKDENIYAVNSEGIYKITTSEKIQKVVDSNSDNFEFAFMAVDNSSKYLYYTSSNSNIVKRVDLNGGGLIKELFIDEEFNAPCGLVVDELGENLYVTDSGNFRVCLMSLDNETLIKAFDTKLI